MIVVISYSSQIRLIYGEKPSRHQSLLVSVHTHIHTHTHTHTLSLSPSLSLSLSSFFLLSLSVCLSLFNDSFKVCIIVYSFNKNKCPLHFSKENKFFFEKNRIFILYFSFYLICGLRYKVKNLLNATLFFILLNLNFDILEYFFQNFIFEIFWKILFRKWFSFLRYF